MLKYQINIRAFIRNLRMWADINKKDRAIARSHFIDNLFIIF